MRIQKQNCDGFEEVGVSLILPVPPSKNRMFTVRYDYFYKPRLIHTQEVRYYYEECQRQYFNNEQVKEFSKFWDKIKLVRVEITYYLTSMRRDTHGMLPILLDTIEKITGINDRYFIITEKQRVRTRNIEGESVFINLTYEANQFNIKCSRDPEIIRKITKEKGVK